MNYEERYNQAIEAAKRELHCCGSLDCDAAKQIFRLFPELRESEDEQHRKWILEYLYDGLRKSDEQFEDQFKSAIAWLEKQGEKPVVWSEEDEDIIDIAIRIIQNGGDDCAGILDSNKALRWLKSLKDRVQPQPKQEWSEDDEKMLEDTISCLSAYKSPDISKGLCYQEQIDWLKSLKPQKHWKPSEEQMDAVKYFIDFHRPQANASIEGWSEFEHLESLYNDLKKL